MIRLKYLRIYDDIKNKNLQRDYEIIRDLFREYDHIIYPRYFNTSQMKLRGKTQESPSDNQTGDISNNETIRMQGHGKFKERLFHKSYQLGK